MDVLRRARASDSRRLVGVDVARCLALVGMMTTHLLPGYGDGGVPWPQQLAGGRASALFAVLAGVSLALMSGRQDPLRGPDRVAASGGLVVRALVIAMLGLLLGDLDSGVAVILTYYGLLFLLGLPFLGLPSRTLALLSLGWLVAAPVVSHLVRPLLPEPGLGSPTLAALLQQPWQLVTELTFTGYYPTVPWLAYLLAGMAVGRLDLRRARTGAALLAGGAVMAVTTFALSRVLTGMPEVAAALRSTYQPGAPPSPGKLDAVLTHGLFGVTPTESWWWLVVVTPHTGTPFDLAHTIGSALAVIGGCLLLSRLWGRGFAVVFGAGAMTLTLYSAHVVMLTPPVWPDDLPADFGTHVAVVLGVGALFALLRVRGPLEAVTARTAATASTTVQLTHGDTTQSSGTAESIERD